MKATLTLLMLLAACAVSHAQDAPLTLTWQGTLTDAGGVPVAGVHDVTFQIYQEPQDGEPVWIERHVGLQIDDGNLLMRLGNTTPLPGEDPPLDPAVPLYLGVTVDDDAEMAPRMLIGGALRARWADRAGHALVADDVPGKDITPRTVAVGGEVVINQDGRWVGEPIAGEPGQDGADGTDGAQGPVGDRGPRGEVGPMGLPGAPGIQGLAGTDGAVGPQGPQGDPGIAGVCGEEQCGGGGPLTDIFHDVAIAGDVPIAIPRAVNGGITSSIDVALSGVIVEIAVTVDIQHPDAGELSLSLVAPNGETFNLKPRGVNGGEVDFVARYPEPVAPIAPFDGLVGVPARGVWALHAIDHDGGNVGAPRMIRGWSLEITRRADDAWRLTGDLVVEGDVASGSACSVGQLVNDGVAVPGAMTVQCGDQEPFAVQPFVCQQYEVCNGTDTDCDGAIDEDYGVGDCRIGPGRACEFVGERRCTSPSTTECFGDAPGVEDCVTAHKVIFAGGDRTCALTDGRQLKCWGANHDGNLGIGDADNRGDGIGEMGANLAAADVGGSVSQLSIGYRHACAIIDDEVLKCWGRNADGRLGIESNQDIGDNAGEMGEFLAPTLPDLSVVDVAGATEHTCALFADDGIRCWGRRSILGRGDEVGVGDGPGDMENLPILDHGSDSPPVRLSAGNRHTCALHADGSVRCWGENRFGQLGQGNRVQVVGHMPGQMGDNLIVTDLGAPAIAIEAGYNFNCALLVGHSIKCWGENESGQLGIGSTRLRGDQGAHMGAALQAVDLGDFRPTQIALGRAHACALSDGGQVKCWGRGDTGQLGHGGVGGRGTTIEHMGEALLPVDLGEPGIAVTAGAFHTCALLVSGAVKCWGHNGDGQLGLGHRNQLVSPFATPIDLGAPLYLPPIQGAVQ